MKTAHIFIFLFFLSFLAIQRTNAQENPVRKDSLKSIPDAPLPLQSDSAAMEGVSITIPTIHPILGKDGFQYNRFSDFSVNPYRMPRTGTSGVRFSGAGSDNINSKSRTAIAAYSPVNRLNIYTAATLGLVETPFFGKGNYYILNAGANYLIAPNLNAGLSAMYNSDFNVLPFWNVSADLQYMPDRNLMLEGSVGYMKTGANAFNLNQSAVLVDVHARYRLSDDWFLNAYGGFPVSQSTNRPAMPMAPMMNNTHYGGTVEYWFQPTVGAEAGLIWVRDMFSGKMRPQPKLELKFRPGR
ncbi:MAG: hypothetical protein Q4G48_01330 [Bacteroidia bacterium]|nr:hypothetical protein [Bacteroidia bacterium]